MPTTQRIASGSTPPGEKWEDASKEMGPHTITIWVDTSSGHFQSDNPTYIASVEGNGYQHKVTGTSSIFPGGGPKDPQGPGFRMYLQATQEWNYKPNGSDDVMDLDKGAWNKDHLSWYVNWIGIDNP
ncbi:hypothetical protein EDD27_7304 [Nonomuraea polychroma]|uniref:Uncharacterized protein n=1 Tax=Nonomuraea polychroma TaxID=46176 RepID=A0A438MFI0_9ACTN|nr:hypothetical protein [Nonomuraea polychroma]RVX44562.1 hypothetical protein EDD27_7304 [Nonomuraea polychroma]